MSPSPLPHADAARRMIAAAEDGAALSALANDWRAAGGAMELLELARALWADGTDAERIVAAKLLTKARIPEDGAIWTALCEWAENLDTAAALPALSAAGARRVAPAPGRLNEIGGWTVSANPLARASALGFAQDLTKDRHPAPEIAAARNQAAELAFSLACDPDPAPRRAAADFLVSLARHDPEAVARVTESTNALPPTLLDRLKRAARL